MNPQNENMNNQNDPAQGQDMHNNGRNNNSPMERARLNTQRNVNQNPYINQSMGQNPYYDNSMNSSNAMSMANTAVNQNPQQVNNNSLLGSFDTNNFIKGALLGAVGAYLLTNENAQKTIFKTVAKSSEMFQAGIEEMKERFEDAKAEMDAER